MSTEYNYDEQGQFFPFFFLTVVGLVTIPTTYSLLRPTKGLENNAPRIQTDFKPQHADLIDGHKAKQKRRERKTKRMITAAIGWTVMAYMIYLMSVTARTQPKIWNPYEILDVPTSATEKQIQSRYRRLSVTMHPDKAQPDASKNETVDDVNERWVEIIKAYKALTDEDVRNNYIQYGNPDGRQSTSFGIALPQFLVTEGNGKYILLVYGALLGVLLPYLVGKWWYGSQKMTREKVLVTSAGNMFKEYNERMDKSGVVTVLSSGAEFQEILNGHKADAGTGQLEKRILADGGPHLWRLEIDDGVRRKALGLLWAYLGRVELDDKELNDEKYEIAPTAFALNEAYTTIALSYGFTQPVVSVYETSQSLIQAMPPNSPPLLQLPGFDRPAIKKIEDGALSSQRKHLSVQGFMDIPESRRREIIKEAGVSSPDYETAMAVAKQLPRLFVVKARFIPPGTTNVPDVHPSDLEDIDPDDTDTKKRRELEAQAKQHQPPLAHAPYFARDHSPRWHLFLADARQGKIAVPPFTYTTFDKQIVDEAGKPTFKVQTLKMQFQAPPQPGEYKFQMHLLCDSYVGFDDKREVVMIVEDPSKAEEVEEEDDISEPEEDSIAGQMAALKGGATAPSRPKKKPAAKDDISDSSDTEEEESSESETDTDTDTDTDEE
ncbi:secretory subunit [Taxawa tesnikishii (nom. ined.)]|nr:secretory subunit [Dothideales sp. JES 119]